MHGNFLIDTAGAAIHIRRLKTMYTLSAQHADHCDAWLAILTVDNIMPLGLSPALRMLQLESADSIRMHNYLYIYNSVCVFVCSRFTPELRQE